MRLIHRKLEMFQERNSIKEAIFHGRENEKLVHCSRGGHKEGTHIHSLTLFYEPC